MKIRNKLSLLFTVLTAAILMVFASAIYYSAYQSRETEFYKSLKKEAITKANLFFTGKVDTKTLQAIYKNNRETLNEVEAAIFDTSFKLLYHDAVDIDFVKETRQMINEIQEKQEIRFYQEEWQVIGILFPFEGKNYVVTAAAYDQYGYNKLQNLRNTILLVFICSIIFIYIAGHIFSKKALFPISKVVHDVKEITATNLDLRVFKNDGNDEIGELADTFNAMLDRLETSFDAQKQFVSNISHELRTPLSAIITELQLASGKDRSIAEYKSVIDNALSDSMRMAKLANSLLDFAKASYDPSEIAFKQVRVDEILLDAQQQVVKANSNYAVRIYYENEIAEEATNVLGNEYLLKTAFANLIENACKFSNDHHCIITVSTNHVRVCLKFSDNGIGIPNGDLPNIFTPFYRGENRKAAEGNGIGLSLAKKIIDLHKGGISLQSEFGKGTTFTINLNYA